MRKETIYETYKRTVCSNCRNKLSNLCDIKKDIEGKAKCVYYEKENELTGYKAFKGRTANQSKPIMKGINK